MIILLMLFRYWNTIWLNSELYQWFHSLTAAISSFLSPNECMRLLITLELKIEEACFIFVYISLLSLILLLLCIFNLPLMVTALDAAAAAHLMWIWNIVRHFFHMKTCSLNCCCCCCLSFNLFNFEYTSWVRSSNLLICNQLLLSIRNHFHFCATMMSNKKKDKKSMRKLIKWR